MSYNIQERYDNQVEIKQLSNGKVVYSSLRPKSIKINPLIDPQIPATDVLRMDKIAFNMYGSSIDWWKIASANSRVNGSMYFLPGSTIAIPSK